MESHLCWDLCCHSDTSGLSLGNHWNWAGSEKKKKVGDTFPSLISPQDQFFHVFGIGIWIKTFQLKLHINYAPMKLNWSGLSWENSPTILPFFIILGQHFPVAMSTFLHGLTLILCFILEWNWEWNWDWNGIGHGIGNGIGLEAGKMVGDTFPSLIPLQDQLFHVFGAWIWKKALQLTAY